MTKSKNCEENWNAFSELIVFLMTEKFLTIDSFGEESLKLLRSEWCNVNILFF